MQSVVLTGARTIISVNGRTLPIISDISADIQTDHIELKTVDNLSAEEIAPTSVSIRMTITCYRLPDNGLSQLGITPGAGQIMSSPYTNVEVRDRLTDATILFVPKMRITNVSLRSPARGPAQVTMSLVGTYGWDELGPGGSGAVLVT